MINWAWLILSIYGGVAFGSLAYLVIDAWWSDEPLVEDNEE